MDLLLRRKILMQGEAPLRDDYITNGLVLWMDGYDKGGVERQWIDKVSGIVFNGDTATTPTALSDCWEFYGANYLYETTSFTSPASASGTIEAVFETTDLTTGQMIFMTKTGATRTSLYFNPSTGRVYLGAGSSTNRATYDATFSTNTKMNLSINNANGYSNGSSLTKNSNSYIGGAVTNYNYIGKRRYNSSTDAKNYFSGKIYSIRIYNRQLTAEEVAHNYEVDRQRFGF